MDTFYFGCTKGEFITELERKIGEFKDPYFTFYISKTNKCITIIPIFKMSLNVFTERPIPFYPYPIVRVEIMESHNLTIKTKYKMSFIMRFTILIMSLALLLNLIGEGFRRFMHTLTRSGWFVLPGIIIIRGSIYLIKKRICKIFLMDFYKHLDHYCERKNY